VITARIRNFPAPAFEGAHVLGYLVDEDQIDYSSFAAFHASLLLAIVDFFEGNLINNGVGNGLEVAIPLKFNDYGPGNFRVLCFIDLNYTWSFEIGYPYFWGPVFPVADPNVAKNLVYNASPTFLWDDWPDPSLYRFLYVHAENGLLCKFDTPVEYKVVAQGGDWNSPSIFSGVAGWWGLENTVQTFLDFAIGSFAPGLYTLIIRNEISQNSVFDFGDTYFAADFEIVSSDVYLNIATLDWSIYAPPNAFYSGWGLYDLWEKVPQKIRARDKNTPQIKVNGEDRGQFERFVMSISHVLGKVIGNVIKAQKSRNFDDTFSDFLIKDLASKLFPFDTTYSPERKRIIYFDSVGMNKHSGVFHVLRALSVRFFGWEIASKKSFADLVFFWNENNSRFIDESSYFDSSKKFFDPSIHSPLNKITYIIDTQGDPDFLDKKERYESFIKQYTVSDFIVEFEYL
jgi:hypothetical protein